MASQAIPSPDVKFLNPDGTVARPWFDFLNSLGRLRLIDLADVPRSTAPANGNTVRYSTASNSFTYGA